MEYTTKRMIPVFKLLRVQARTELTHKEAYSNLSSLVLEGSAWSNPRGNHYSGVEDKDLDDDT